MIDSGIDYNHSDFENRIFINENEIPGNGIDDDQNGYIDDYRGWDFTEDDNDVFDDIDEELFDARDMDDCRTYSFFRRWGCRVESLSGSAANIAINLIRPGEHGHGTHVSGIIVRNTDAKILPLRVKFSRDLSVNRSIFEALKYAEKFSPRVINMSFGGIHSETLENNRQMYIDHFKNNPNTIFVVAAGNSGVNLDIVPYLPAMINLPNVFTIGAVDSNNNLAPFTNWSEIIVDFYANGVDIESSWPGGKLQILSGTSMATPKAAAYIYDLYGYYMQGQRFFNPQPFRNLLYQLLSYESLHDPSSSGIPLQSGYILQ